MRGQVIALVLALGACEKSVHVMLVAPPGEEGGDLSCVNRIGVIAQGNLYEDYQAQCIAVPPGAIRSLRDHDLAGLLDLAMPSSGLLYLEVVGMASPVGECDFADTVFHGAAQYRGGDSLPILLRASFDCADRAETTAPVSVIDLAALVATGTCAPTADGWMATGGSLLATGLSGQGFEGSYFVPFASTLLAAPVAAGVGEIALGFDRAAGDDCIAVALDGATASATACVTPGAPTACPAPAGAIEVGWVDPDNLLAFFDASVDARGTTLVTVWNGATRRPVTGATVRVPDDVEVQMVGLDGTTFVSAGGTATGAAGSFVVLSREPVVVTIDAPGLGSKTVHVGSLYGVAGSQIVVL